VGAGFEPILNKTLTPTSDCRPAGDNPTQSRFAGQQAGKNSSPQIPFLFTFLLIRSLRERGGYKKISGYQLQYSFFRQFFQSQGRKNSLFCFAIRLKTPNRSISKPQHNFRYILGFANNLPNHN
jgi:hypothetical protein